MSPLAMPIIGAGVNLLGGALGDFLAQGDDMEYQRLMREAADQYGNVSAPALQALMAQQVSQSAQQGAPDDFGNKGSRNAAIQALMREGLSGGTSLESQLTQANAQRAAGQATRQGTQSALQSAARRGMGGAASTLQAQLMGASTGADRAAQVGLQGAADARRNALMALQQGGAMAGGAEQADSDRDARRRESMDRIALFNAEQRAANERYNSGLEQQRFTNDLSVRDRKASATQSKAGVAKGKADRTRQRWGGLGQAAGAGFASGGG